MFEDSTFESNGKIHTRSRRWALAALILNCTILALIVLLPLIYPEAIHSKEISTLLIAPQPPVQISEAPKPEPVLEKAPDSSAMVSQLTAPRQIPTTINMVKVRDPDSFPCPDCIVGYSGIPGANSPGTLNIFRRAEPHVVTPKSVRISKMVVEGMLLQKTPPIYPALARQMRVQGTVELAAIISKTGTIESLHVVSGSPMLQQSALDAVKTWRYRPYLLNDEAVEVETSVNVVFKLDQ
jgi:protein TonB